MGFDSNNRKGFTLIELIMVIVVVAIIAAAGSSLMGYLIQNAVYIPNQLNMDMVVADAVDVMIEGDNQAKGLRFNRSLTNVQDYQLTFINQDNQTVRFRMDTGTNRLYRSINGATEVMFPYYVPSGVTITGKSSKLFSYFDVNEATTAVAANVRRIALSLIAQTGNGNFLSWEGSSDQSSSIAIRRYQ